MEENKMSIKTQFAKILDSGNELIILHKNCKNSLSQKIDEKQMNWLSEALNFSIKNDMTQLSIRVKEMNNEFQILKDEKTDKVGIAEINNNKIDHLSQKYCDENIRIHEISDNYDKLIKEKFANMVDEVSNCKLCDWVKEHPKLVAIYGLTISILVHIIGSLIFYLIFGRMIY